MPSNKFQRFQAWLAGLLGALEHLTVQAGSWAGKTALVLLVVTGEAMALPGGLQGMVPMLLVQGIHMLAGVVLLLALLASLTASIRKHWPGRAHPAGALPPQRLFTLGGSGIWLPVHGASWVLLLVMGLTGLERFFQLHLDVGLLPYAAMIWWPLHSALRPFLYALLLLILVQNGKIWLRQTLTYLRTP